jgi:micrococcal nuclease
MRHSWAALLAVGLVAGTGFNQAKISLAKPIASSTLMRCTAVDGDTLRCGEIRVRLSGVDAAELSGHCRAGRDCAPGDPLKHHKTLEEFVRDQVFITPLKTDKYRRTVALVTDRSGHNASCVVIAAGARYVMQWDEGLHVAKACIKHIRFHTAPRKES